MWEGGEGEGAVGCGREGRMRVQLGVGGRGG